MQTYSRGDASSTFLSFDAGEFLLELRLRGRLDANTFIHARWKELPLPYIQYFGLAAG